MSEIDQAHDYIKELQERIKGLKADKQDLRLHLFSLYGEACPGWASDGRPERMIQNAKRYREAQETKFKEEWEEGEKLGKNLQDADNEISHLEAVVQECSEMLSCPLDKVGESLSAMLTEYEWRWDSIQELRKRSETAETKFQQLSKEHLGILIKMSCDYNTMKDQLTAQRDKLQTESDNAFCGLIGSSRGECVEWGRRERQEEIDALQIDLDAMAKMQRSGQSLLDKLEKLALDRGGIRLGRSFCGDVCLTKFNKGPTMVEGGWLHPGGWQFSGPVG